MKKTIISILIGIFCISLPTPLKAGVSFGEAISSAVLCQRITTQKPLALSVATVNFNPIKFILPASSSSAKEAEEFRDIWTAMHNRDEAGFRSLRAQMEQKGAKTYLFKGEGYISGFITKQYRWY